MSDFIKPKCIACTGTGFFGYAWVPCQRVDEILGNIILNTIMMDDSAYKSSHSFWMRYAIATHTAAHLK